MSTLSFPGLRRALVPAILCAVATLAGCGGGGATDPAAARASGAEAATGFNVHTASSELAGICTLDGQQRFTRSLLDERYLWADEIPAVQAASFDTVRAYFNALLVRTPDANGAPRDRFSAVISQASGDAMLGTSAPAAALLTPSTPSAPMTTLLASASGRRVGYLLLNDHRRGAQDALIDAFQALQDARVQDLVLDLRSNSGGYLYVAQAAASMVTGPQSSGQVFEQLRYNARREAEGSRAPLLFTDRVVTSESRYAAGQPLPQLKLPRVYVLASGITCSASESIINSLRGIDVEVVIVGETTCGKPYGFHRQDNCGLSYFALEFQGFNARGFGDYSAGFAPTCPVAEDPKAALGSAQEPLLAAALQHIETGACPAPVAGMRSLLRAPSVDAFGGRLLTGGGH